MPSYILTSTFTQYIQSVDVNLLYFDINAELILLAEKWTFRTSVKLLLAGQVLYGTFATKTYSWTVWPAVTWAESDAIWFAK